MAEHECTELDKEGVCPLCQAKYVVCEACSIAGNAGRAVWHLAPACDALASQTPTPEEERTFHFWWQVEGYKRVRMEDVEIAQWVWDAALVANASTPTPGPTSETGSVPASALGNWWTPQTIDVIRHARTNEPHDDWNDWQNAISSGLLKAYNRGKDERALAKNASAPTVCPAGPVVEGELRALAAKWREESDWMTPSEYQTPRKAQLRICAEELEAALTNDPPTGKQSEGTHE